MTKKYCFECWAGDYPIGFAYKEGGCYDTPEERDQWVKYINKHKYIKQNSLKLFESYSRVISEVKKMDEDEKVYLKNKNISLNRLIIELENVLGETDIIKKFKELHEDFVYIVNINTKGL